MGRAEAQGTECAPCSGDVPKLMDIFPGIGKTTTTARWVNALSFTLVIDGHLTLCIPKLQVLLLEGCCNPINLFLCV